MSKLRSFCPYCGRIVPAGCRCDCRPRPPRSKKPDTRKREGEPWRSEYSSAEYRRARQEACERTRGHCTDCGKVCAWHDGAKWRTQGMGGEVDHVDMLRLGGTSDASRLDLVCKSCHAKRDAARRKKYGL